MFKTVCNCIDQNNCNQC